MPTNSGACVIGSGPNGLTAAIVLAKAGLHTTLYEAETVIGGGARSATLTLPGFIHDVCSAVHPLAVSSSFFRILPLARYGLEFIDPEIPVAHPLDGTAVALTRSVEETSAGLGPDASAYLRVMRPLVRNADFLM